MSADEADGPRVGETISVWYRDGQRLGTVLKVTEGSGGRRHALVRLRDGSVVTATLGRDPGESDG